jgi:hypothetical protein
MANTVIYNVVPSIEEARQRGQSVWDLYLEGFSSGASGNVSIYPEDGRQALTSVYAITIGNRSHLDRCFVLWDPQATLAPIDSDDGVPDFMRRVTTTAPLIFPQTGNVGPTSIVVATPPRLGAIRVAGDPADFIRNFATQLNRIDKDVVFRPVSYIPVGGAEVVIDWDVAPNITIAPVLHLQFYLQPPNQVPYGRAPYRQWNGREINLAAETLILMCAIHGRRLVRVEVTTDDALVTDATVRVGAFSPIAEDPVAFIPREFTIATGAIVSSAPASILITNPVADWLTVYATSTSGVGNVNVKVYAID